VAMQSKQNYTAKRKRLVYKCTVKCGAIAEDEMINVLIER
jgi:hypothetical protein